MLKTMISWRLWCCGLLSKLVGDSPFLNALILRHFVSLVAALFELSSDVSFAYTLALPSSLLQGVRTKTVKKSARTIVEKYYTRLTLDFHTNKRIIDEVAILPSKRMRNKIAGYTTHLMRRIDKGPVRGISLKLQEEERERRLDFVPEVSALDQETIQIDPDTRDLLESLGHGSLSGVAVNQPRD